MAFDKKKWVPIEGASVAARMFLYSNTEDDTVTAAGYFVGAPGLIDGAQVRVIASAGTGETGAIASKSTGTYVADV